MPLVYRRRRRDVGDDYLALQQQGKPHAEIAYGHPLALQIGRTLHRLLLIQLAWVPEEMKNHVKFESGSFR